jgi:hypothetical protein
LLKARKELTRQTGALQEFTDAQEGEVSAWRKAVDDFETGASTANPYELPHAGKQYSRGISFRSRLLGSQGPMLRDIELELVREEQEQERNSTAVREATDDTMIEYLMLGVEIEGQQCMSFFKGLRYFLKLTVSSGVSFLPTCWPKETPPPKNSPTLLPAAHRSHGKSRSCGSCSTSTPLARFNASPLLQIQRSPRKLSARLSSCHQDCHRSKPCPRSLYPTL